MGEINYDFNFLFKKEEDAKSFAGGLVANESDSRHELIALINRYCNSGIDSHGVAFDIGSTKLFRNEVQISCYTGRSSEFPTDIVAPLQSVGCDILKLAALYEDASTWTRIHYLNGKKAARKQYDEQFKKFKLEDKSDQLQRLLSNERFAKADKIVDDCDLTQLVPEDEYLFSLIATKKHLGLATKLLHAGLFAKGNEYQDPWLNCVAQYGDTRLLKAFLDDGMDPYAIGESEYLTALHCCLYSGEEQSLENTKLIISRCADNLNPVTEEGSPLWFGYHQLADVASCVLMQQAGAKAIAPDSYYANLDGKELTIEAVKHGDYITAKESFDSDHYYEILYWALRHQCYELVRWLDHDASIDWKKKISSEVEFSDEMDKLYADLPLYEIPFAFTEGPGCDHRLIDHIIDRIKGSRETYSKLVVYVSRMNYMPQSVALLTKLVSLGADVDQHAEINGDTEKMCAVEQAMLHECLDNLEYLIEAGANTAIASLPLPESFEDWLNGYEGETRRRARSLFKKHKLI